MKPRRKKVLAIRKTPHIADHPALSLNPRCGLDSDDIKTTLGLPVSDEETDDPFSSKGNADNEIHERHEKEDNQLIRPLFHAYIPNCYYCGCTLGGIPSSSDIVTIS